MPKKELEKLDTLIANLIARCEESSEMVAMNAYTRGVLDGRVLKAKQDLIDFVIKNDNAAFYRGKNVKGTK